MSLNQQINNTKVSPLFTLMALALLFALGSFAEAGAQWTTPDANQNINNTNSGNVGIGTTTPTALLEVKKSQSAGTTVIVDNPFTTSGNSAYSGVFLKQAGANRLLISSINDNHGSITPGTAQFWNFANGPTVFATNNTEQMRITANGNVGIGTSNPGKKLEVLATDGEAVRLYRNASNAGWGVNMKFAFNNSNGTQVDYAGLHGIVANATAGSEAGDFIVTTATSGTLTEKLRVTSAGNVGIGTNSPLALLDVRNSDGLFYAGFGYGTNKETFLRAGSSTTGVLHVGDVNTTKTLLQESSGNVGIGTATPN